MKQYTPLSFAAQKCPNRPDAYLHGDNCYQVRLYVSIPFTILRIKGKVGEEFSSTLSALGIRSQNNILLLYDEKKLKFFVVNQLLTLLVYISFFGLRHAN